MLIIFVCKKWKREKVKGISVKSYTPERRVRGIVDGR